VGIAIFVWVVVLAVEVSRLALWRWPGAG
jgi:hypothetical protein